MENKKKKPRCILLGFELVRVAISHTEHDVEYRNLPQSCITHTHTQIGIHQKERKEGRLEEKRQRKRERERQRHIIR